jgi:hypothetical protein
MATSHPWEIHNIKTASQVGANMAKSAIGSLSNMVSKNPKTFIRGTLPCLGSKLTVRWKYLAALLGFIVAVHSAVFGLNFWAVRHGGGG